MASLPLLTILEQAQVSPPPATLVEKSLSLTFFDFFFLSQPPLHELFLYELPIDENHFVETIIPSLKNSLSITLQHFYPFAGNIIIFPNNEKKPEIRYVEGDFVKVTFAKSNPDFNDLVGNHPRDCDQFYDLIPALGESVKTSEFRKIPLFSVQVTLFPQKGVSIGMTNHHSLADASTLFCLLNAWTSISRSSTDESFLTNGTKPCYDRVINNPKLDQSSLEFSKVDTLYETYQPISLSKTSNRLRGTFILTRKTLNELKKRVLTEQPTLSYVSSFTVACGYIWSCIAKSRNDDIHLFGFAIDCKARLDPPVPSNYFGNCVEGCLVRTKTSVLKRNNGFVMATKLIGESLHNKLTEKGEIVKGVEAYKDTSNLGMPTCFIGVAGTPKLKYYETDFGWGKPKKFETISIDYDTSISMNACKELEDDLEIGVCLKNTEMESFVRLFEEGLESYVYSRA
ncbi:malonyl-coenzyme A:anthocyanin 3-O-glucoside-6''-O-malonyltransferase-like [Rutidosis leptorrhynchoides]|uniref:malonyl-coenzyme A:anthocyanin 3-O-glucoside-6''-O-malonyltransferase-like n=1 Tax=Rutidosis leptorrhynchoides TaxID=125765 RepID=UPI003A997E2D